MEKKWTKERIKKECIEWAFCLIIAYVIYLLINFFIGTVSGVKQESMKPTAVEGEKLLISRTIFGKKELKYGDIITFLSPDQLLEYSENKENELIQGNDAIAKYEDRNFLNSFIYNFIGIDKKSFIKRVIGVEGDHIEVKEDGFVYRNDTKLEESYLKDGTTSITGQFTNVIVPKDSVFVMGDNRLQSMDSRTFGCVPIDKIDGYVISRIWPLNKMGELK